MPRSTVSASVPNPVVDVLMRRAIRRRETVSATIGRLIVEGLSPAVPDDEVLRRLVATVMSEVAPTLDAAFADVRHIVAEYRALIEHAIATATAAERREFRVADRLAVYRVVTKRAIACLRRGRRS